MPARVTESTRSSSALVAAARASPGLVDLVLAERDACIYVVDRDRRAAFLNRPACACYPPVAGDRCFETILSGRAPCKFCPLPAILSGARTRATGVVECGSRRYGVTISRLVGADGTPLALHVLQPLQPVRTGGTKPEARPGLNRRESPPAELADVDALVGTSGRWREVTRLIRTVAAYPDVTVLIVGETGTGKEMVAQAIHRATHDGRAPFVPINCSAIPETLLESELFGYERGAFTGATERKPGLFELADGGTLFLDEVGQLSLALQPKLLRVLDTKCLTRLGGTVSLRLDCRVLCASSTPLGDLITRGAFRQDLYQRLSTVTITLPPLRERPEDIPSLAAAFIAQAATRTGHRIRGINGRALGALARYSWPGNVRELRKVIERAVIFTAPGTPIALGALPPELRGRGTEADSPVRSLRAVEHAYLAEVLARCRGNQRLAADRLGISRNRLRRILWGPPR